MKKPIKKIALISIMMLLVIPEAMAADNCEIKACIEVYTQDGHLVIEGRKGSGPQSSATKTTTTKKPAVKKSSPPKVKRAPRVVAPRPATTTSKKPVVRKPRKKGVTEKVTTATSIEDKLIESIPTAGIAYQPSFSPLVQTPVFFWSDIPTLVTKKIEIVGELVDVRLRPTFIWHYGDGVIYATREVGAPFPEGKIRHTYSKPGHYLIELITRWDGEFTVDGVTAHIPGEITTVSALPITVVAAPIRFVN